jgi:hypothetical protein
MNRWCSGFIVVVRCFELAKVDLVVHQIIDGMLERPRLDLLVELDGNHSRLLSFVLPVKKTSTCSMRSTSSPT